MMGSYRVGREVAAGCFTCDGYASYEKKWTGGNAQGVAARHAQAHNHSTWVHVEMFIHYGPKMADPSVGLDAKRKAGANNDPDQMLNDGDPGET